MSDFSPKSHKNRLSPVIHKILPIPHSMFDRHGGISSHPYNSLNVSYGVADYSENVTVNRTLIKKHLRCHNLQSCRQVHKNRVAVIENSISDQEIDGFDGLVTDLTGVALMIQQADCQAVLLYDPYRKAIGAVHCGWRGSVLGILSQTISTMEQVYQSRTVDLIAVISPSLGPCCAEFINYRKELPERFQRYQVEKNHFDFWKISKDQLIDCGLQSKNIQTVSICSACSTDYFSYRRAMKTGNGITGRNGSVISLPPP